MHTLQPIPPEVRSFDWAVLLYGLLIPAIMLIALGLWMLWGRRGALNQQERHREDVKAAMQGAALTRDTWRTRLAQWRDTRTEPTRLVLGMSMLMLGYHIAAYVLPPYILPFHVPWDRAWILGLGIAGVVTASMAIDRMQAGGVSDEGKK
ncbi:hypothetical protein LBMAG48_30640 [Phycisphaerae bacterium]|nr:hypothetical protein LBMAG48_30640 [Phycisphaerae bacterium]